MKVVLIHQSGAGSGELSSAALVEAIAAGGWTVEHLPREGTDAQAIAAAAPDLIAIAGGDGTVARIVRMLPDRSVPLAIVPTGTANNIARSLGICGTPAQAIAEWDLGRRRRLDIGRADGPWGCRPFVEGVGFGAFADSLRIVTEWRDEDEAARRSGEDALRAAVREAAPLPLEVSVDGAPLPDELLLLEVMNVPMSGPRLAFAPEARPGDGMLHLSWLMPPRREAMVRWVGASGHDPPLEQLAGREVTLTGGGVMMRIDDHSRWLEPRSQVTIRLEGEPVQVLAPAAAPALAG